MKKPTKQILLFSILILIIAAILIIANFSSPEQLVQKIGIHNSYLILFITSFFGGFSSGGTILFLTTLTTLIAGGLPFFASGIIAGTALAIGDTIMLSLFLSGRKLTSKKTKQKLNKLSNYLNKKPSYLIPIIVLIYIILTPLPNDILILSLAAINYPRKKSITLLIIGDITYTILYSFLIFQGVTFFL